MSTALPPDIQKLLADAAKAAVREVLANQPARPAIMRIADLMDRLNCSRSEVYRLIERKALVPRKQGSITVFLTAEVDRYVSGLPRADDPEAPPVKKRGKAGKAALEAEAE